MCCYRACLPPTMALCIFHLLPLTMIRCIFHLLPPTMSHCIFYLFPTTMLHCIFYLLLKQNAKMAGKLQPKWVGPYLATQANRPGAYNLQDSEGNQLPHTWNIVFWSNLNCKFDFLWENVL